MERALLEFKAPSNTGAAGTHAQTGCYAFPACPHLGVGRLYNPLGKTGAGRFFNNNSRNNRRRRVRGVLLLLPMPHACQVSKEASM